MATGTTRMIVELCQLTYPRRDMILADALQGIPPSQQKENLPFVVP
jgi:hypothetical protein